MKQLLTYQEAYAKVQNIYQGDADGKPCFKIVGEPEGRPYQTRVKSNITGEELKKLFEAAGLGDYFECESCEGMLYLRYYVPNEIVDISSTGKKAE